MFDSNAITFNGCDHSRATRDKDTTGSQDGSAFDPFYPALAGDDPVNWLHDEAPHVVWFCGRLPMDLNHGTAPFRSLAGACVQAYR